MSWTSEDEHELAIVARRYRSLLDRRPTRPAGGPIARYSPPRTSDLYRARRLRDGCFPSASTLFGEPAWDMILDLHGAHERMQSVTISSACLGALVPLTSGRRYLRCLERAGMVRFLGSGDDARTRLVALTPTAVTLMGRYLDRL